MDSEETVTAPPGPLADALAVQQTQNDLDSQILDSRNPAPTTRFISPNRTPLQYRCYKCEQCKAVDQYKCFMIEELPDVLQCWNCKAGGGRVSLQMQMQQRLGMFPYGEATVEPRDIKPMQPASLQRNASAAGGGPGGAGGSPVAGRAPVVLNHMPKKGNG